MIITQDFSLGKEKTDRHCWL